MRMSLVGAQNLPTGGGSDVMRVQVDLHEHVRRMERRV